MEIEFFPIYFKEEKKSKTLKELFLNNLYGGKFFKTYYDEECTRLQCHIARRSVNDLYRIAKTYFPDVTLKEVLKVITENFMCFYCSTIEKLVFVQESNTGFCTRLHSKYTADYIDSDSWSYNKILNIINDENT